jgi:hypothetical protein
VPQTNENILQNPVENFQMMYLSLSPSPADGETMMMLKVRRQENSVFL